MVLLKKTAKKRNKIKIRLLKKIKNKRNSKRKKSKNKAVLLTAFLIYVVSLFFR